jgi:dipeptidyl aminopeptidase/acylaminoacyl peptidase
VGADSLAYITDRAGENEIRIRRLPDGTERVIAGRRNLPLKSPAFVTLAASPDGSRLLFTAWDGKKSSAWIAPIGGLPIRLGADDVQIWSGTWSPDGREIASVDESGGSLALVRRRVGSSDKPVPVPGATPYGAMVPQWSPGGDWIAYRSGDTLAVISPDGQRQRDLPMRRPTAVAWSRDSATLFAIGVSATPALQAIDVATGMSRTLRQFDENAAPDAPVTPGQRLSLAPDGRSLLTSVLRHRSDIWRLER